MTKSETLAELTADDITKLKGEKMGNGCLWVVAVPAFLISLFFLFVSRWSYDYLTESILKLVAAAGIPLLLLIPLYKFIKKKDTEIDADIAGGQKKVIIAPITNKRIESSDITSGKEKGGISSKYFMTIAEKEYPMAERKYLMIPVGEFMEIHQAPNSGIILKERWLKQDGAVEEDKNETQEK
ncbi:MAG: hypothetical protein M3384_05265 [Acidobacteriota bacterium]|nr:hypothetical protein [Acidobacteriota bacterium]